MVDGQEILIDGPAAVLHPAGETHANRILEFTNDKFPERYQAELDGRLYVSADGNDDDDDEQEAA